jgi:hypothetical protein
MNVLLSTEIDSFNTQMSVWSKSLNGDQECVFKDCCKKYKKKGKYCKKCPKK